MDAKEHIQAAKVRSAHLHPYLATAVFSMRILPSDACPTMGVDNKWNCYYNPKLVETWTVEEVATVLEHEVWHLLRKHHDRKPLGGPATKPNAHKGEIHKHWNLATDCEINDGFQKTKFYKLPEGAIYPSTYNLPEHEIAEWYYDRIPAAASNMPQLVCIGEGDEEGAGGQPGQQGNADGVVVWGGSCADGVPRPWEEGGEHLYPIDKELVARQVAKDIKAQSGRGTVPSGQERWADDTLKEPIIPWNKELSAVMKGHFASLSGRSDITYSRRNRHQSIYGKIIRPSQMRLIPTIAVVVDTSGSVSEEMLSQALTETHHILKASEGVGVHVLSCDSAVHNVQKVFNRKQIRFAGNGGTDMVIGIEAALKLKPHIIVLITDGFTPYPETCPDANVRWVTLILADSGSIPKYGKAIRVNTPAER